GTQIAFVVRRSFARQNGFSQVIHADYPGAGAASSRIEEFCGNRSLLSPLRGSHSIHHLPTAYAVGFILAPLRGSVLRLHACELHARSFGLMTSGQPTAGPFPGPRSRRRAYE